MGLAHRWRQPAFPGAVQLAPPAVAIAVRRALPVLLPQQHQRDAGPAQLVMDIDPIGLGLAPRALLAAVAGIQHRLQHAIGQRRRQRPAQPRCGGALQAQPDGAARQAQRPGNLPVARPAVLQAQDLAYASHRHSLGWHRSPRSSFLTSRAPCAAQRSSACHPFPGVADFKSEWPRSNRNQWPTSFRNRRPTSPGICSSKHDPPQPRCVSRAFRHCLRGSDRGRPCPRTRPAPSGVAP